MQPIGQVQSLSVHPALRRQPERVELEHQPAIVSAAGGAIAIRDAVDQKSEGRTGHRGRDRALRSPTAAPARFLGRGVTQHIPNATPATPPRLMRGTAHWQRTAQRTSTRCIAPGDPGAGGIRAIVPAINIEAYRGRDPVPHPCALGTCRFAMSNFLPICRWRCGVRAEWDAGCRVQGARCEAWCSVLSLAPR